MQIHDELHGFLIRMQPFAAHLIGDTRDGGDDQRQGEKHPEKPVGFPDFRFRSPARFPHPEAGYNQEQEPGSENDHIKNRSVRAQPCPRVEMENVISGFLREAEP